MSKQHYQKWELSSRICKGCQWTIRPQAKLLCNIHKKSRRKVDTSYV